LSYFNNKQNLQPDVFKDSRIERFCPDIIHQISKDDELSQDDSDDENAEFTQKNVDETETRDEVDDVFKEKKKVALENLTDNYSDIMETINKNFYEEKFKQ